MKRLFRMGFVLLMMSASFLAGLLVRGTNNAPVVAVVQPNSEERFPLLLEAVGYVDEFFVKDMPDKTALEYALIRAYLAELGDPYTFFIEPAVAASESNALAGRYGGIGVSLQRNEQGDFVIYPYDNSPATRAGLRDGDVIVAINGTLVDLAMTMDMMRQMLRGEIKDGAGVNLKVRNIAETEEREYFIEFDEILEPSIIWRVLFEAPEIGYMHIMRFTSRTPEEFAQAVEELRAENISALVLDLRNNAGGLLFESMIIAGEFLDGDAILIEKRVSGQSTSEDEPGGLMLDLPVIVLVNNGTASAAEIVAGALQSHARAKLIGQTTYGKGSIQRIFPLGDQSSIHVTTALWFTPDGHVLDGAGLQPDISMIPDENGRDVELGEAIRYLRQELEE